MLSSKTASPLTSKKFFDVTLPEVAGPLIIYPELRITFRY